MTITKNQDGEKLTFTLGGRLDTIAAPELDSEIKASLDGVKDLVLDISGIDYISSAGLRVLLSAHKTMNKQGNMKVTGASQAIMEIFDITGFIDLINIEE